MRPKKLTDSFGTAPSATRSQEAMVEVAKASDGSWPDVAGQFDGAAGRWPPPDGTVDIITDVIAVVDKFANRPGAPRKARADVDPCRVDFKIQFIDIVLTLDAFRGLAYPCSPTAAPCSD